MSDDRRFFPEGWFEIGVEDDPDRRRHWAPFDSVAAGIGEARTLFVTVGVARIIMVNGQWKEARRNNPALRLPDYLIGSASCEAERPLEGLFALEAETFAQLLGGRLPREKELDRMVTAYAPWRVNDSPWMAWTESCWSLFSYSLCCWNEAQQRWESPRNGGTRAVGGSVRSVLKWDGHQLSRQSREPFAGTGMRAAVVFDV